ncbi:jg17717 [Pararge aegeria aegeria]|uniref:Jg17717 protein n=1 Tax=Pararge aegeria aegeria TaxID=348720 RepID=A0A8S4S849_9NEOP|nr:jg17717 [Pararge aegeria aegeria]
MRPPRTIQFIKDFEDSAGFNDLVIVVELDRLATKSFLKQANATRKLRNPYRWLIINRNSVNNNKIPIDLNDLSILLDSEVILSQKDGNNFSLNLIYKLKSNSNVWKFQPFGKWTPLGLNLTTSNTSITIGRKNLEGMPISVSVVVSCAATKTDLLTLNLKLSELHIDFVSKASTRQVTPLYDFMNATRVLVFTDTWGYVVNGTYNGMIGDLVRGAADLTGTLGRVVMFLMFLLFLFLYTSYSANIVALLQSSSNEIQTLTDLLNSKMELGVEDTPYNRHFFSTSTEPVRKAIYEKKIAPRGYKPSFMSLEEGVKKLQKKPFAFNMFVGGGYRLVERFFLEHEKCGLQEIQYIQENKPWLTCKKNSPFTEIYKIGLTRNHEHGLNDRVNRMIYAKKPACIAHGGIFDSVNMTDFYPALLMLVYGMILALVLMFIEILHFHRCRGNSGIWSICATASNSQLQAG